jgi:2-polyprenyl-6-hydroxyphenyl methylase/3-demethylubiquinone-9 3-methyltransferase
MTAQEQSIERDRRVTGDTPRFQFGEKLGRFFSRLSLTSTSRKRSVLCATSWTFMSSRGSDFSTSAAARAVFSLSAMRMSANVSSFDYDERSVRCAVKLKEKYFPHTDRWKILQGSVLDRKFIESLGTFDICYAWGVLHHTGSLWQALFKRPVAC